MIFLDLEMVSLLETATGDVNTEDINGSKSKLSEENTESECSNEKDDNDVALDLSTPEKDHDPLSVDNSEVDPLADVDNQQLSKSSEIDLTADVTIDITESDESRLDKDPLVVIIADDDTPVVTTVEKDNGPNRNNPQETDGSIYYSFS